MVSRRSSKGVEKLESRTLLAALPAPGPDGYGYAAESHPFENINLPTDPSGNTQFIGPDLGSNTFNFYGINYTKDDLLVDFDGIITFGDQLTSDLNGPLTGSPFQRALAPLWDDWRPLGGAHGQVVTKLENTGGDSKPDRLIVQWKVQDRAIPANLRKTIEFQAILQLNTGNQPGDIIFNYVLLDTGSTTTANGASATVGIKDFGYGSNRVLVSNNDPANTFVGNHKAILIHADAAGQPRADAGGTVTQQEGQNRINLTLDGSGSRDPNQSAKTLKYAWDLDLDGIYGETSAAALRGDESGVHPTYVGESGSGLGGAKTYPVALRVTDASGQISFDQGFVAVGNLAPGAPTITGPSTASGGVVTKVTFSASDPGNSLAGYTIDWGDGTTGNAGSDGKASHAFYLPGTYTITAFAYDSGGTPGGGVGPTSTKKITIGARPDVLLNTAGVLVVTTGAGNDTISLSQPAAQVRLNRNGVITTYAPADVKGVNIVSGDGNDTVTSSLDVITTVTGGNGDDSITTGPNIDHIDGGEGNNIIDAGSNSASIQAGSGDDIITADFGEVAAGAGDNNITLGAGLVTAGDGDDTLTGDSAAGGFNITFGGGNNVITLTSPISTFGNTISVDDGNNSITTVGGADVINCGDGENTIRSSGGDDRITTVGDIPNKIGSQIESGTGDDLVVCGFATTINSGAGNDTISVRSANQIVGRDGDDRIGVSNFLSLNGTIDAGSGDDVIHAVSDAAHPAIVFGGDGDDNLFTGAGFDSVYGGAGQDTVHSGDGADLLSGGGSKDRLYGQGGKDRLYGGNGNDIVNGGGGNDRLTGDRGRDSLYGDAGDDVFSTKDGLIDHLFGDAGNDTAVADVTDVLVSVTLV